MNDLLDPKEKERRIDEILKRGVQFHTFKIGSAPITEEEARDLVRNNIDAIIGNKKVMNSQEAIARLKEIRKK